MLVAAIEMNPLASLFGAAERGRRIGELADAKLAASILAEKRDLRWAPIVVHMWFAFQVPVYGDHIEASPQLAADLLQERPAPGRPRRHPLNGPPAQPGGVRWKDIRASVRE